MLNTLHVVTKAFVKVKTTTEIFFKFLGDSTKRNVLQDLLKIKSVNYFKFQPTVIQLINYCNPYNLL